MTIEIEDKEALWEFFQEWEARRRDIRRNAKRPAILPDSRIVQFVDEMCEVGPDAQIEKEALHDMYLLYSADYRGGSIFARELRRVVSGLMSHRPSKANGAGQRPRYWQGIRLKSGQS